MSDLIPAPDLEIRNAEQLAAEAIARTSGGLSLDLIDSFIDIQRRLRVMVEGGAIEPPVCPELTNANPSSPHTVQLEAEAWLLFQVAWRINLLPKRDQIEFARLFKIALREAELATTLLTFSVAPPPGVDVTVPSGTQISTDDGKVIFQTTAQLVIPSGDESGEVAAVNAVSGPTLLSPNTLIRMVDAIAWVEEVSNLEAIDGGGDQETIEEALERARNYQQRTERLVTTRDLELAILEDVLRGQGIVRGFPFVVLGDFAGPERPGHTTVVVMTRNGNPISFEAKQVINSVLEQVVGNQFVYLSDPIYVNFNVTADMRLLVSAPESATLKAIETNLRAFYAPSRENFGRDILRSEVIAVIEGTPGVDRISSSASGPILASPLADSRLDAWQLPKIVTVTLDVV